MTVVQSPYSDLTRPPLHERDLHRALVGRSIVTDVRVLTSTGSTQADAAAAARVGAPEGLVLIAESQSAGRGRLGRTWLAPPRAAITLSVLLRPGPAVPVSRFGWLPLLTAVAVADSLRHLSQADVAVKWPNDILIRPAGEADPDSRSRYGKCAGILAEVVPVNESPPGQQAGPGHEAGPAVIIGIGVNVSQRLDELPDPVDPSAPEPTSLAAVASACTDRDPLVRSLLRHLGDQYDRWREAGGDAQRCGLRQAYRQWCATVGRDVTVSLPGGGVVEGQACDVDTDGRLVVASVAGVQAIAAGDVVHVR